MITRYSLLKKLSGNMKDKLLSLYEERASPEEVSFEEWQDNILNSSEFLSKYTDVPVKTWDKQYHRESQPWDLDFNTRGVPETIGRKASLTKEDIRKDPFSKTFMLLLDSKSFHGLPNAMINKIFSYFRPVTTMSKIDDVWEDPIRYAEKGVKVRFLFLSPSSYFQAIAKNRKPQTSEQIERDEVDEEKVQQYVQAAKNGEKFPCPSIDLTSGDQEGRHRTRVVEELGLPYVPVFVYDFYKPSESKVGSKEALPSIVQEQVFP